MRYGYNFGFTLEDFLLNVLITGVSSGLGLGFAKAAKAQGDRVYGVSRRDCPIGLDGFAHLDLSDFEQIEACMRSLLSGLPRLDLVILNAGRLGVISPLNQAKLEDLKASMDINLWSNQVLCQCLFRCVSEISQLVMISSGASVNGNAGWGGYSLSKATLNMLVKLWASERPSTHFTSFAPGLIDTAMQDTLCDEVSPEVCPSVERLRKARGTEAMPQADEAGAQLWPVLASLKSQPSGSFLDIRKMSADELRL